MTDRRILTAAASQFSLACSITSLYYMVTLNEHVPEWFFPMVLLPYSVVIYAVNRLFLRRERTLRAVSILNAAAGALLLCAYLYFESWKGLSYLLVTAGFIAWLTVRGGQLAYSGPNLQGTLLTLDGSFVAMLLITSYTSFAQMGLQWSYPSICGFAAAVIAVACVRNSQPLGWKSWIMMCLAFFALFLCLGLLLSVAAAPAGSGLVALWALIVSAVKSLGHMLMGLLKALLSLFPADPGQEVPTLEPAVDAVQEMPIEQTSPVLSTILLVLLAVLLIALVVWVVRCLGKIKLGGAKKRQVPPAAKRERPSLWASLCALVRGWLRWIRLRLFLRRSRNTPKGLYFLLVHRCRRGPWRKQSGETPREFLGRLSRCAQDDPALAEALTALTEAVDAEFYSGRPSRGRLEYAPLIRHKIGAAAFRQSLRDLLAHLRPKTKQPAP